MLLGISPSLLFFWSVGKELLQPSVVICCRKSRNKDEFDLHSLDSQQKIILSIA